MQIRIRLAALAMSVAVIMSSTASAQMKQQDVVLSKGGVLRGQMLTAGKTPVANEEVRIYDAAGRVTKVTTDKQGAFQATGLAGGSLVAQSKQSITYLRGWPEGTQPRHAAQTLSVQAGSQAGFGVAQAAYQSVWQTQPVPPGPTFGSPVVPQGNQTPPLQGPFQGGLGGNGPFSNLGPGKILVGGALTGLGIWGIVELAQDDDSAS